MDNVWSPKTAKFDEEENEEQIASSQKFISGTNEQFQISENEDYLDNLLASVNAGNAKANQEELEKHKREEEERKKEEARIHAEQQKRILAEQYEQEQMEKAQREAEEAEEEARLVAEEEKKKQNNMFRRMMGKKVYDFSDIDKEQNESNKAQSDTAQSDTEKAPEPSNEIKGEEEVIDKDVQAVIPQIEENKSTIENEEKEDINNSVTKSEDMNISKNKKEKEKSNNASIFGFFTKKKTKLTGNTNVQKEENKDITQDFEYLATHDELTGLKNERGYQMDIKNKSIKGTAILFFDVNNLKYTNDNLGHQAGNKLLLSTSDKLKELFPECGYRIGGDEFLVVLTGIKDKDVAKKIDEPIEIFRTYMKQKTKDDEEGIIYSASVGYEVGTTEKTLDEVKEKADKKMYANKQAYKKSNPQYDMRNRPENDKQKNEQDTENYDDKLSKEQRALKTQIQTNHQRANKNTTERIMMEIQRRAGEVVAILIASASFDHLFIIQDVNQFIEIMMDNQNLIDYSYLYVIYEGGPQYYGSDEYLSEVTHLFEAIENKIKNSRNRNLSDKEILKIKGINVFKNIYL